MVRGVARFRPLYYPVNFAHDYVGKLRKHGKIKFKFGTLDFKFKFETVDFKFKFVSYQSLKLSDNSTKSSTIKFAKTY